MVKRLKRLARGGQEEKKVKYSEALDPRWSRRNGPVLFKDSDKMFIRQYYRSSVHLRDQKVNETCLNMFSKSCKVIYIYISIINR